jgi:hypothetical protein
MDPIMRVETQKACSWELHFSQKKIVYYNPTRLTRNWMWKRPKKPRKDGKSIGQAV